MGSNSPQVIHEGPDTMASCPSPNPGLGAHSKHSYRLSDYPMVVPFAKNQLGLKSHEIKTVLSHGKQMYLLHTTDGLAQNPHTFNASFPSPLRRRVSTRTHDLLTSTWGSLFRMVIRQFRTCLLKAKMSRFINFSIHDLSLFSPVILNL